MIYVVHRRTKEHRVSTPDLVLPWEDWEFLVADADGWIEWIGGECPLPSGVLCEVMLRDDGRGHKRPKECEDWTWEICGARSDIIAYRPILSEPHHAPEWDGEGKIQAGMMVSWERYANPVRVKFAGEKFAIVESDFGQEAAAKLSLLRPIRSEEDKAVEEMIPIICNNRLLGIDGEGARDVARALYRAGYRKTATADGEDV